MVERYALERIGDEHTARIALSYAVPAGHALTGRLLHLYGGLQTVQFALGAEPPGADPTMLRVWRGYFDGYDPELVTRGLDLADQHGLVSLIPGDPGWPTGMDDLRERTPVALWTRGDRPELLDRPLWERVTVAGARTASFSGRWDAQQLAVGLALRDVTIVAASSHGVPRMALAGTLGSTSGAIAVVSSGLDDPYPRTPNGFFNSIAQQGILVSETPPGIEPSRGSLQGVSRIAAALSAVTTLVESGPRGQAMDTAYHALNLLRQVGAIRGPEDEIGSIGPNMLLDDGRAVPVMDRDDVVSELDSFHRKSDNGIVARQLLHRAQTATPEKLQRPQSTSLSVHGNSRSL